MNRTAHPLTAKAAGPTPSRVDLRQRDPDAVATARQLIAALDGVSAGDVALRATATRADPGDVWLSAPGAPMVAVRAVGGSLTMLHPDRVDAVARAIDAAAPLLDAVEARTGWRFEFDAAPIASDPAGAVVEVAGGGHAIALAIGSGLKFATAEGAEVARPGRIAGPVPLSLVLAGPSLSIPVAGGIGVGDLLMLGAGPWRATVDAAGIYQQHGHYSATGTWTMHDPHADDEGDAGAPGGIAAFAVPVSVHLPDTSAALGTLEALVPGAVLPILPLTGGLRVDLRVAGRVIAWGEIVRLGDHYAVAVDRVPGDTAHHGDA